MNIQSAEVILYVADPLRSKTFYNQLLNRLPDLDVPGMTEYNLHPFLKLGLMPDEGIAKIVSPPLPHPSTGTGIPRCELYLMVNDLDACFAKIIQSGALEISPVLPRNWGHRGGYLADPDGHVIGLAENFSV